MYVIGTYAHSTFLVSKLNYLHYVNFALVLENFYQSQKRQ